MSPEMYEAYVNFIEKILYESTSISDYLLVLDSLNIQYRGNRCKGGCHHKTDELCKAGYNVYMDFCSRHRI